MHLEPLQSIVTLFVLLACVGCGVYLRWAKLESRRERQPIPLIMTPREAVARHLFGEHVAWMPREMALFDNYYKYRKPWLDRADELLATRSQECTSPSTNTPGRTRSTSSGTSTGEVA